MTGSWSWSWSRDWPLTRGNSAGTRAVQGLTPLHGEDELYLAWMAWNGTHGTAPARETMDPYFATRHEKVLSDRTCRSEPTFGVLQQSEPLSCPGFSDAPFAIFPVFLHLLIPFPACFGENLFIFSGLGILCQRHTLPGLWSRDIGVAFVHAGSKSPLRCI